MEKIKVLFIHVGDPLDQWAITNEDIVELKTILGPNRFFYKKDLINNIRTRSAIKRYGNIEMDNVVFVNRRSLLGLIMSGIKLRALVKQEGYDLVHSFWGSASGLVISIFVNSPTILSFAGSDLYGNYSASGKKTFSGFISTQLTKMAAFFADHVIVMSNKMLEEFSQQIQKKISVIPEGIDLSIFYPLPKLKARSKLKLPKDKKLILFFPGRNAWVKDPILAKAVFNYVKDQINDVVLIEATTYSPDEMKLLYSAVDVLLITSRHEGSNNSIKEALACNCPVVSTDVGDAEERLGNLENCYVSNSRDYLEIGKYVVNVLGSSETSKLRNSLFDVEIKNLACKTLLLYEKILM